MPESYEVNLVGETLRHARDIVDIWRHEAVKDAVGAFLHWSGGNTLGELMLRQLADVQPVDPRLATEVGGIALKRPVGLGPGYDKRGTMIRAFEVLGAGHASVGGYTLDRQWGKPMPRVRTFNQRVGDHGTRISHNAYGFPNPSSEVGAENIEEQRARGATIPIVGQVTVRQEIFSEGRYDEIPQILTETVRPLLPVVDAINIGLSSPNIEGMRANQRARTLIESIWRIQDMMAAEGRIIPIILKGDGDGGEERNDMYCVVYEATKIILELINTTSLRRIKAKYGAENLPGGLAGADPDYRQLALDTVKDIYEKTGAPIIGMGGISNGELGLNMIGAGASALSVFSAIPDQGLGVIGKIGRDMSRILTERYPNVVSLDQFIGKDTKRGSKSKAA